MFIPAEIFFNNPQKRTTIRQTVDKFDYVNNFQHCKFFQRHIDDYLPRPRETYSVEQRTLHETVHSSIACSGKRLKIKTQWLATEEWICKLPRIYII